MILGGVGEGKIMPMIHPARDPRNGSAGHSFPRVLATTREAFLGRLGTLSAYLALDPEARAAALARVAAVLPDAFDVDATVRLSLSRRPRRTARRRTAATTRV